MFVEEILYHNIPNDERDKIFYMVMTLDFIKELKDGHYEKEVKGSKSLWFDISRKLYRSPRNYNMNYRMPTNEIAHTINNTLIEIKEIVGKKRNNIALEYLFGYRQDNKINLLKNSEGNEWLKEIIYNPYKTQ